MSTEDSDFVDEGSGHIERQGWAESKTHRRDMPTAAASTDAAEDLGDLKEVSSPKADRCTSTVLRSRCNLLSRRFVALAISC